VVAKSRNGSVQTWHDADMVDDCTRQVFGPSHTSESLTFLWRPIVPTVVAAGVRADRLYLPGYNLEVIHARSQGE
jgi:hypothetical protein